MKEKFLMAKLTAKELNLILMKQIFCRIFFNQQQVEKIKEPDDHALEPVDPYYGSESFPVIPEIPQAYRIAQQEHNEFGLQY